MFTSCHMHGLLNKSQNKCEGNTEQDSHYEKVFTWGVSYASATIIVPLRVFLYRVDRSDTDKQQNVRQSNFLPAHVCVLQCWAWSAGPRHVFPPLAGAGLSHFLFLYFKPPPQVLVHCPKILQGPQLPSTKKYIKDVIRSLYNETKAGKGNHFLCRKLLVVWWNFCSVSSRSLAFYSIGFLIKC